MTNSNVTFDKNDKNEKKTLYSTHCAGLIGESFYASLLTINLYNIHI